MSDCKTHLLHISIVCVYAVLFLTLFSDCAKYSDFLTCKIFSGSIDHILQDETGIGDWRVGSDSEFQIFSENSPPPIRPGPMRFFYTIEDRKTVQTEF